MYEQILISVFIGIILGAFAFYLLNRMGQKQFEVSSPHRFSEKDAESLLVKYGYEIKDKQPRKTIITTIDGKEHLGYLEADYLVRKDKKDYLVVIKTGEGASDPNEPAFRRKLIELEHVFIPDGLLLLDISSGELASISFHFPRTISIDSFFRFFITLFVILVVIGIIWLMIWLKLF